MINVSQVAHQDFSNKLQETEFIVINVIHIVLNATDLQFMIALDVNLLWFYTMDNVLNHAHLECIYIIMANAKNVTIVVPNVQDQLIMIVLNAMLVEYYTKANVFQHAQTELLKM